MDQSKQETPEEVRRRKYPALCELRDQLQSEKDALLKIVQPAREDYERLSNDPRLIECRQVIKQHSKRLAEIDNELGGLAKAMGGRSLSGG